MKIFKLNKRQHKRQQVTILDQLKKELDKLPFDLTLDKIEESDLFYKVILGYGIQISRVDLPKTYVPNEETQICWFAISTAMVDIYIHKAVDNPKFASKYLSKADLWMSAKCNRNLITENNY